MRWVLGEGERGTFDTNKRAAEHHVYRGRTWSSTVFSTAGEIGSLRESCSYIKLLFLWKSASPHGRDRGGHEKSALVFFFHLHANIVHECFGMFSSPLALPIFSSLPCLLLSLMKEIETFHVFMTRGMFWWCPPLASGCRVTENHSKA